MPQKLVYSQLNEVKGKTITEKLNKAVNSLLLNGVTLDSKDDKYIPLKQWIFDDLLVLFLEDRGIFSTFARKM